MTTEAPHDGNTVEIRRYSNRRYYDTSRSQHVTMEQIHQLVLSGREVRVTDSKSGEDLTARVLTQIVLDLDPPKLEVLPAALLHQVIRSNQEVVSEFIETYFTRALEAFLESQQRFEAQLRQTMGLTADRPAPWAEWSRAMAAFMPPVPGFGARGPGRPGQATEPQVPELQAAVEQLRQQVAELPQALGRRSRREGEK